MADNVIKVLNRLEVNRIRNIINESYSDALNAKKEYEDNEKNLGYEIAISIFAYYDHTAGVNSITKLVELLGIVCAYDMFKNEFQIDMGKEYDFTENMKTNIELIIRENKKKCIEGIACYNATSGRKSLAYHKQVTETMDVNIAILKLLSCLGFTFSLDDCEIRRISIQEKKVITEKIELLIKSRRLIRETVIAKIKGYYNYLIALEDVESRKSDLKYYQSQTSKLKVYESALEKAESKLLEKKKIYFAAEEKDRQITYSIVSHFTGLKEVLVTYEMSLKKYENIDTII